MADTPPKFSHGFQWTKGNHFEERYCGQSCPCCRSMNSNDRDFGGCQVCNCNQEFEAGTFTTKSLEGMVEIYDDPTITSIINASDFVEPIRSACLSLKLMMMEIKVDDDKIKEIISKRVWNNNHPESNKMRWLSYATSDYINMM